MTPKYESTIEWSLYDNECTRKKHTVMDKWDIIMDDQYNEGDLIKSELEDFLQFGKKYSITLTIEEVGDAT